ncbi:hypothetical protein [Methylotuvimicrobium sp. KM2]|uniref:hypothetical protein n=1 Tax=Methylotuvimicrobium sp. KM2 TaxID=3133976 RepID=UPI0031016FFD
MARTQGESGPPKAIIAKSFFAAEIGRTPFQLSRKILARLMILFSKTLVLTTKMKNLTLPITILCIMVFCTSCTTYLEPSDFDMDEVVAPYIKISKPIAVKAHLIGTKKREQPLHGASIIVNEDEFTKVLADKIESALKDKGYSVVTDSDLVIEVQVGRVSLQPTARIHCVIDYNQKLGDGKFYGYQTSATNWNFKTACEMALQQAANEILSSQSVSDYFQGE